MPSLRGRAPRALEAGLPRQRHVQNPVLTKRGLVYLSRLVLRVPGLPLIVALSLASCAAPLGDAHPCPEQACSDGRTCVAGRCRPQEAPLSAGDALRVVLAPADVAVVSLAGGGGGRDLPEAVALGREEGGSVVMLFRFEATWRDDAEVASAFILLDPLDGAPPSLGPISFEMARIVEAWEPALMSWGRQPRLSVPMVAGTVRARHTIPLRIDVTPLVRAWSQRSPSDHGIALIAKGNDANGAVVSMGVSRGMGPRLEAYVK